MRRSISGIALNFKERPLAVLILLVSLLLFDPLLPGSVTTPSFLAIAIVSAWIASDPGEWSRKAIVLLGCAVGGLLVYDKVLRFRPDAFSAESVGIVLLLMALALYGLCGGLVLRGILRANRVTHHLIIAALNLYILLGVCWAHVFTLLDRFNPRSFVLQIHHTESACHFIYFSFVTLASLGYGDITPKTPFAQRLAIIEAVMGQFYGSVVVAYLVSVYIGQQRPKDGQPASNDGDST